MTQAGVGLDRAMSAEKREAGAARFGPAAHALCNRDQGRQTARLAFLATSQKRPFPAHNWNNSRLQSPLHRSNDRRLATYNSRSERSYCTAYDSTPYTACPDVGRWSLLRPAVLHTVAIFGDHLRYCLLDVRVTKM